MKIESKYIKQKICNTTIHIYEYAQNCSDAQSLNNISARLISNTFWIT